MVIDGGGFARSRFDVGERVVAPYLWSRKILRIDVLVASHGDWDHQGGLHYLARVFAPRELWLSRRPEERPRLARLEEEVRRGGGLVRTLVAGEAAAVFGGLVVDCLHPPPRDSLSPNDSSLVLRLRLGRTSILFTGDVEAPAEAMLAERFAAEPVTVLKVPHHGSATSSGEALLRWARPEIAVISVGSGNGYGLPHPAVLQRYARFGVRRLRIDRDGSVAVVSAGEAPTVRTRRDSYPQFCSLLGALC
jgi:competence protein ComEC